MMQLRLQTQGRKAVPLEFAVVGELRETDLAKLAAREVPADGTKPLQRIRNRHHAIARLVAGGTPEGHVAVICGISVNRISILKNDPTFKELVEFYRAEIMDEYRSMHAQLAGIGEDALAELRERLETEPEKMSNTFLLDIVTKTADRTGNGPSVTNNQNVTVTLDLAARMKSAREAAQRAIEGVARDITPEAAE